MMKVLKTVITTPQYPSNWTTLYLAQNRYIEGWGIGRRDWEIKFTVFFISLPLMYLSHAAYLKYRLISSQVCLFVFFVSGSLPSFLLRLSFLLAPLCSILIPLHFS